MPSGAARVSVWTPTMPPAPGWFSITTGFPSALASAGCAVRVIVSTPDPVAFGRTMRTAFSPTCASGGCGKGHDADHGRSHECAPGECKGNAGHHVSPIVVVIVQATARCR